MPERRSFLMLAFPYQEKKHKITGWFWSEKMDGIRVLWDGGITRGLYKSEVPWANTDKDERYVESQVSTGLWTRYGNLIHAPDWFLDQLPDYPLDGELFTDRKSWQELSSIIKKLTPNDTAWQKVTYNVFDVPPYQALFTNGLVNDPNFVKQFDLADLMEWARPRIKVFPKFLNFAQVTEFIRKEFAGFENVRPVQQNLVESLDQVMTAFNNVLDVGGEGLIVRNPRSYWEPKRSNQQVKIKADKDDEGTVTGYVWGRQTDRGSKLLGMMGALILDYKGKYLELGTGFTDELRRMTSLQPEASSEGERFPGMKVSQNWYNESFRLGTRVTFKYRELSDTGIPKEARYKRKRDSE